MYKRQPIPYTRAVSVVCVVVSVALAAAAWAQSSPTQLAVVSQGRVPIHYGMGDRQDVYFELQEGDRVRVKRREGEWMLVVTANEERGWAHTEGFTLVGPPYRPAPVPWENRP